ncbi:hypothetical protein Btru_059495 [Bulinus truncatus]|nr:hypothetical protein Btru_059495 [Bulinus truncatus]
MYFTNSVLCIKDVTSKMLLLLVSKSTAQNLQVPERLRCFLSLKSYKPQMGLFLQCPSFIATIVDSAMTWRHHRSHVGDSDCMGV